MKIGIYRRRDLGFRSLIGSFVLSSLNRKLKKRSIIGGAVSKPAVRAPIRRNEGSDLLSNLSEDDDNDNIDDWRNLSDSKYVCVCVKYVYVLEVCVKCVCVYVPCFALFSILNKDRGR